MAANVPVTSISQVCNRIIIMPCTKQDKLYKGCWKEDLVHLRKKEMEKPKGWKSGRQEGWKSGRQADRQTGKKEERN